VSRERPSAAALDAAFAVNRDRNRRSNYALAGATETALHAANSFSTRAIFANSRRVVSWRK